MSEPVLLDFQPARDGFAFPNRFRWTETDRLQLEKLLGPLPSAAAATLVGLGGALGGGRAGTLAGAAAGAMLGSLGLGRALARGVAARWPAFGLCGGMAAVAADRWPLYGGAATADLKPAPMRAMLWRRQGDTLRAHGARFLRYWLPLRTRADHVPFAPYGDDLLVEYARIRSRIAAGRPVVVGLVGDAPDPFAMHQVLAFGYRDGGAPDLGDGGPEHSGYAGGGVLYVYDPNTPGKTMHIELAAFDDHQGGPRHAVLTTDLRTGIRRGGRAFISRRPGHLSMLFAVDA